MACVLSPTFLASLGLGGTHGPCESQPLVVSGAGTWSHSKPSCLKSQTQIVREEEDSDQDVRGFDKSHLRRAEVQGLGKDPGGLTQPTTPARQTHTCVTFSLKFCVRSTTLWGAMISISVGEPERCFSRLNSTKLSVN